MKKPIDNLLRLLLCVLLPVAATSAQLKQEREITPHRGYSAPKLINSAELQTMLASAVTDLINAQREKPFKPERPKLYAAGLGVSFAIALLLGFSIEHRRNVMLGEWELPSGTPVLARLPFIEVPLGQASNVSTSGGWFSRKKPTADSAPTLQSALDRS